MKEGETTVKVEGYWTCVIPSVPLHLRTQWHPTERKGPFETLQRGAFLTEEGAIRWGIENLAGLPYTVRFIPSEE